MLSWLFLRGRCRSCGWRIPLRYPLVEVLTALLWLWVVLATPPGEWGLLLVRITIISGLIVATFVDFDCFEIPDEVSIGGMVLAPLASFLVPSLHEGVRGVAPWLSMQMGGLDGLSVTRHAALMTSLLGMLVGGGGLWAIGWLGSRLYGKEAMGFGDVKLLAAGGGFLGPGGVAVALMIGALLASVVGVANVLRFFWLVKSRARVRRRRSGFGRSLRIARIAGRYMPFGPYLAMGIGIILVYWNDVITRVM